MDIRKVLGTFSKKSFLGAVLLAMALWLYASLSSNYTIHISIPLDIQLPEDRAFEDTPVQSVAIEAKGTGWNLFNLIYFNNSKKIVLDLKNTKINEAQYIISRSELQKGVQSFERVEISDVLTENVVLKTGEVKTYKVPVKSNLKIIPAEGFYLVGKPKFIPDEIEIRGNDRIVGNIKSWGTKPVVIENVNSFFSENIDLSDTLKEIVRLNTKKVRFTADIQQTAEVTFNEIRISIRGGVVPKNHILYPEFISVTFRGGINEIIDMTPDKVSITLNSADILNDKTGILIPKIEFPGSIKVINTLPKYIHNYKIVRNADLSKAGL